MPAKKFVEWNIPDPKEMNEENFRKVRDLIKEKVNELVVDLYRLRIGDGWAFNDFQPEPQSNSEQKADETHVRLAVANANVIWHLFFNCFSQTVNFLFW